jgi:uncharacterized protein (TIRG00374 family)
LILSIGLSAAFLYLAFRGTDPGEILRSMRDVHYEWLLLSFGALLASHALRAYRWRILLAPMKEGIGFRNLFSSVILGYFFNNLLPRAGELARPYTIGRLEKISGSGALGTVVMERILDTVAFLTLVFGTPLVYSGPLLESFPWLRSGGIILAAVTVPFLLLLVALMFRRDWTDRIFAVISRVLPARFSERLRVTMHAFLDGFEFVRRPAAAFRILVMTAGIWYLYMLMTYLSFFAFDLEARLGWGAAWVTLAISSIGVAIPTPGGTGTYHAFASQTLTQLFGVDATTALSFATATHAIGYIGVTLLGLWFFLKDHLSFSEAVRGGQGEEN